MGAAGPHLHTAHSLGRLAATRDRALAEPMRRGDLLDLERLDNPRLLAGCQNLGVAAARGLSQAQIELSIDLRDAQGQPPLVPAAQLPDGLFRRAVVTAARELQQRLGLIVLQHSASISP